jgi:histidine triad (HIT) family protein
VLPKKHMANILECDGETMKALLNAIQVIAKQENVAEDGFRIVSNCGRNGAQSVNHLHIHLMGGAQLSEKMS